MWQSLYPLFTSYSTSTNPYWGDLINVQTVAKPFPGVQVFLNIRGFTLQGGVRNVRNEAEDFITAITPLTVREYMLQRNPRNESVIKKGWS